MNTNKNKNGNWKSLLLKYRPEQISTPIVSHVTANGTAERHSLHVSMASTRGIVSGRATILPSHRLQSHANEGMRRVTEFSAVSGIAQCRGNRPRCHGRERTTVEIVIKVTEIPTIHGTVTLCCRWKAKVMVDAVIMIAIMVATVSPTAEKTRRVTIEENTDVAKTSARNAGM